MGYQKPSLLRSLAIALAWFVVIFLLMPMLVTFPMSLTPERFMSMPSGTVSFRHYETLISDPIWRGAIRDSIVVAIGATVTAVVLGGSIAIGLWQVERHFARYLSVLPLLPLIVPPIVSALALSRAALWFGLLDTYTAVIASHAIVGIPFVFMTVSASLEGLDFRTVQAARSLGSSRLEAVWDVVVPNIRPGLLTGALFAFFNSWDELIITIFITSRNVFTLPRKIWSDIRDNIDPAVAAASASMIAITLVIATAYFVIQATRSGSQVSNES